MCFSRLRLTPGTNARCFGFNAAAKVLLREVAASSTTSRRQMRTAPNRGQLELVGIRLRALQHRLTQAQVIRDGPTWLIRQHPEPPSSAAQVRSWIRSGVERSTISGCGSLNTTLVCMNLCSWYELCAARCQPLVCHALLTRLGHTRVTDHSTRFDGQVSRCNCLAKQSTCEPPPPGRHLGAPRIVSCAVSPRRKPGSSVEQRRVFGSETSVHVTRKSYMW